MAHVSFPHVPRAPVPPVVQPRESRHRARAPATHLGLESLQPDEMRLPPHQPTAPRRALIAPHELPLTPPAKPRSQTSRPPIARNTPSAPYAFQTSPPPDPRPPYQQTRIS